MGGFDEYWRNMQKVSAIMQSHKRMQSMAEVAISSSARIATTNSMSRLLFPLKSPLLPLSFLANNRIASAPKALLRGNNGKLGISQALLWGTAFHQQTKIINDVFRLNKAISVPLLFTQAAIANQAVLNMSNKFLTVVAKRHPEKVGNVTSFYEKVAAITSSIENDKNISVECFNKLEEIVNELKGDLGNKKLVTRFMNIIGVIGFILGVYSFFLSLNDSSNDDTIRKLSLKIDESEKRITQHNDSITSSINPHLNSSISSLFPNSASGLMRISCQVHFKPSKNSGILCPVSEGQRVRIITTWHKWSLIIFQETESSYLYTGWIYKKNILIEKK